LSLISFVCFSPIFRAYHKIKRLGDEENKEIFSNPDEEIVIEEKMDGANFRFMFKKGKIIFGSRTQAGNGSAVVSNSTRLVAGGNRTDCCTFTTVMDYVTIASTGNFTYFGALQGNYAYSSATANATRGVWATWGRPGISPSSTWDYITLASTGNAQTFGSAVSASSGPSTCGGAHGGLQ
jgi:hypothetical protein